MIRKLYYLLIASSISLGIMAGTMNVANAYMVCRCLPGQWIHGKWHPPQKVCKDLQRQYYRKHCRWIPAHYHHGSYIPGHKLCWRQPACGGRSACGY